jgi:flavin reductase (DIM6/NTAB) family NADH-FMN oxidoreductase RutF
METFNYGVNVVGFIKDNHKYGMTCSWAMQADYDKVLILLGEQSVTGTKINKGDIIGVTALADKQEDIANKLGNGHSDKVDKFVGIDYFVEDDAILINNARMLMKIKVIDVLHLRSIEDSNLVYGLIIRQYSNEKVEFLNYNQMK